MPPLSSSFSIASGNYNLRRCQKLQRTHREEVKRNERKCDGRGLLGGETLTIMSEREKVYKISSQHQTVDDCDDAPWGL